MTRTKGTAPEHPTTRLFRGVRLFREKGHEITRTPGGTYHVPSCTGDSHYVVYLITDFTCCSCLDHHRSRKAGEFCKHVHAAGIVAAKRRAARRARRDDTLDAHAYCSERLR
jgi:hypothetical protein